MIIDSHRHVGDFPPFSLPCAVEGSPRERRDQGVAPALVFVGHSHVIDIDAAMDVAAPNPNVDLETSGVPMHSKTGTAVECVDDHRVRCDSDTPFLHPSGELAKVRVRDLSTDLTDRVLGENGRALFFGEDAPMVVS